jgi:ribosome-associated translation inhibitor RaiA
MKLTPTITFRDVDSSPALEAEIPRRIDQFERYYGSIVGCRVLVEFAGRHHEAGNRYHVRIDLTVPGEEVVVAHAASLHATDQDIHLASTVMADRREISRMRRVRLPFDRRSAPCIAASRARSTR